jgi:predicted ATPase
MLKFITLKRFKCFSDMMMQLAPLSLITGVNGAGKSSVIQALLILRQSYLDKKYSISEQLRINGDLTDVPDAASLHNINSEEEGFVIELEDEKGISCNVEADTSNISDIAKVISTDINSLERVINNWPLFKNTFAYLYSDRGHPLSRYERKQESITDSRLGDRYGSSTAFCLQRAINTNMDVPIKALQRDGYSDVSNNVSAWESYILGEVIDISSNEVDRQSVEITYSFKSKNGEDINMSPVNMAFGNSYVLPIIVGILTAEKDSLFIVENPEAHLHPSAQTRMGEFLSIAAANGIQIIVETHSDHLINGVRLAVLDQEIKAYDVETSFFTIQDGEHVCRRVNIDEKGTLNNWPIGFFDEWENNLMKLAKGKMQ